MKVTRERPCQRRFHRVTAPLDVTMPDGRVIGATNWSLGELRLDGMAEPLPKLGARIGLPCVCPSRVSTSASP